MVIGRIVRPLPVVAEMPGQQHGHQIGGRHARRRMAGPGGRARNGSSRPAAAGRAHGHHPTSARSLRTPFHALPQGTRYPAPLRAKHMPPIASSQRSPMAYAPPMSRRLSSASSGRGSRLYRAVRHEVRARPAVALDEQAQLSCNSGGRKGQRSSGTCQSSTTPASSDWSIQRSVPRAARRSSG